MEDWIKSHRISEVECLIPDMSGIARGKILPASRFLKAVASDGLRIPEGIYVMSVTGEFADEAWGSVVDETGPDVYMRPDPETIRFVPWYQEPTAQVICDAYYYDGREVEIASRSVLKRVLKLYEERGWRPVVAPEIEFFLVKQNEDPDYPLAPPIGRSGRPETGRQAYGIDAINEFDPLFEDVYDYCEEQELEVETLIHEGGAAQCEVNLNHGDPLSLADQVFLFKRTMRQAALRHKVYATFMAKPMANEPGSAMHVHQSIVDVRTGENLFSDKDGNNTELFMNFIAGQQKYLINAMLLLAPNVNSYRRIVPWLDAPINVQWGVDNRTVGLRVPISDKNARRLETRLAGADANAYLAIAGSLACGYLGMVQKLQPTPPCTGDAYKLPFVLPRHLDDAIAQIEQCQELKEVLGERFVGALCCVKRDENEAYRRIISSWEREHLLLNV